MHADTAVLLPCIYARDIAPCIFVEIDMIDILFDELRTIGLVTNSCDFSRDWLGRNESYYRGLRSKSRKPSMAVLVACASKMKGLGDSLTVYGDDKIRAKGRKLKRLARRCIDEMTNGNNHDRSAIA